MIAISATKKQNGIVISVASTVVKLGVSGVQFIVEAYGYIITHISQK